MHADALTPIAIVETLASVRGSDGDVLATLLRLGSIRIDRSVPTAAVGCTESPVLRINPDFVARYAATPERLHALVLHELLHVTLGHTRRGPRVSPEDNLVYDAIINATICRLHPSPAFTDLFTTLYAEDRFPECLLRPAPGWRPTEDAEAVPVPPALADSSLGQAAAIYRRLYSIGCTESELRELLRALGHAGAAMPLDRLLGDHTDADRVAAPARSALGEIIRGIVTASRNRGPEDASGRRGEGGPLVEWDDERIRNHRRRMFREVRDLIRDIGGCDHGPSANARGLRPESIAVGGPATRLDRRGVVARALGTPWLLGSNHIEQLRRVPITVDTHLYFDVSASMNEVLPIVANAILSCRRELRPRIHQFSTVVESLAMTDLAAGRLRTTGGTDIGCVAAHMHRHQVERAVIVTDGFVGRPHDRDQANALRAARLGVVVSPGGTQDQLRYFADRIHLMEHEGDRA